MPTLLPGPACAWSWRSCTDGGLGQRDAECVDRGGIELRASVALQLHEGNRCRARRTVGAGTRHGVEGVGHVHDPRVERNVVGQQAEGIALAVGPLMVQLDDREMRLEEGYLAENAGAKAGMATDLLELVGRQRTRLAQDVVGDADLADVVQQRAEPDDVDFGFTQGRAGARSAPTAR